MSYTEEGGKKREIPRRHTKSMAKLVGWPAASEGERDCQDDFPRRGRRSFLFGDWSTDPNGTELGPNLDGMEPRISILRSPKAALIQCHSLLPLFKNGSKPRAMRRAAIPLGLRSLAMWDGLRLISFTNLREALRGRFGFDSSRGRGRLGRRGSQRNVSRRCATRR